MRMAAWVALLLSLMVPTSVGQTPNQPPDIQGFTMDPKTVDITDNAVSAITFFATVADDDEVLAVQAVLRNGALRLDVPLDAVGGNDWFGFLDERNPDLLVGSWTAVIVAFDDDGGVSQSPSQVLQVTAVLTNGNAPLIGVLGTSPGTTVMGPNSALRVVTATPILHKVTYRVTTAGTEGPEIELSYPYILDVGAFSTGEQNLTVRAYDRALRVAQRVLEVRVDLDAPKLKLVLPAVTFLDVPFTIGVEVQDASNFTLSLTVANETFEQAGGGNQQFTFTVTRSVNGTVPVHALVIDEAGNSAEIGNTTLTRPVLADSTIRSFQFDGKFPLPNAPLLLRAEVGLKAAPTDLDVRVVFLEGDTEIANATRHLLPQTNAVQELSRVFSPGIHILRARAVLPTGMVETNTSDQEVTLPIEVYLGRLQESSGRTYMIRASPSGLPSQALDTLNNKLYELKLVEKGAAVVFQFTTSGNRTLEWDPLNPFGDASTTSSSSARTTSTKPDKDSPAPVAALLLFALLALAARRR